MVTDKAAWLAKNLLGWKKWGKSIYSAWVDPNHAPGVNEFRGLEYLSTGNGMLEIIEAMWGRGWRCHLCSPWEKRRTWLADFFKGMGVVEDSNERYGDTPPAAVIEAAYAALQERG